MCIYLYIYIYIRTRDFASLDRSSDLAHDGLADSTLCHII